MDLPIDPILPDLVAALDARGMAVLQAPPGAGKTTRVPLALLKTGRPGRIVMLEPRRLAARAAAERLAESLGEDPGQTVGYRMRGATQIGKGTRIEVVTEGILTRMIQSDPELSGIGTVIFDEFHERSLNADLGLALCLEIRGALRPDLRLLAMSATLDAAPVAALMDNAPIVTSEGRSYPVTEIWRDKPLPSGTRLEQAVADTVMEALAQTTGGVLVFLPGQGEIRRAEAALAPRLPAGCILRPLFGAMPFAEQRKAIRPDPTARKIVLATSIAETSLTIEDIRVVVDAGLSRRARFDPGSGMSRLVTEKVSRAEATQRGGRAGRVAPGHVFRLWTRGEHGALPAFPPVEMETADLAPLALDLALWGSADLPFLTPPPDTALAEARALLRELGALDAADRITDHGRSLAAMPLHPRLAHMLARAGAKAAPLAALLAEMDPMVGAGTDLGLRLRALTNPSSAPAPVRRDTLDRIRQEARRLQSLAPAAKQDFTPAQMAALAYPDRIAKHRPGDAPRFLLSGGKGAKMDPGDPLAGQGFLVVTDTDGDRTEARIRLALTISESALREALPERLRTVEACHWDARAAKVLAERRETLGALVLKSERWTSAPAEARARAMLDGIATLPFPWTPASHRLAARVALLRVAGHDLPDLSEAVLLEDATDWLLPFLSGIDSAAKWRSFDLLPALEALLGWDALQVLNREAPAHYTTPLGRQVPIDYGGDHPSIELRLQELFGETRHPTVAGRPLRITLLSPAHRPVQTTMDLPGFWASSYADVRKDMRGRYPRHPWPEDPTQEDPTLRAKRRG